MAYIKNYQNGLFMKKKVIFSNYDDLGNLYYGGGGAVAIHEVAKRLVAKYFVEVITSRYPGSKKSGFVDGVYYRRVGWPYAGGRIGQIVFLLILPFIVVTSKFDVW